MTLSALLKEKLPHLLGLAFALLFTAACCPCCGCRLRPLSFSVWWLPCVSSCPWAARWPASSGSIGHGGQAGRPEREVPVLRGDGGARLSRRGVSSLRRAGHGASMAGAVGDARRDMEEYREYIETWIHEVKTPIAAARLCLENHPGPLADSVEDALFQIEGYVEQALFYARSGAVDRDYAVRALPLSQAVSAALRRYARPLIEAGFRVELGELDGVVCSDGKWVEFILGQLISNSSSTAPPPLSSPSPRR